MKRILPLVLIALGILLTLGALLQFYVNSRAKSLATVDLPDQLAGLSISDSKTGANAVAEFTDLHGEEFPITSGAVGIYGSSQITLWIAGTSSESVASKLTSAMHAKIAEGNSPFKPINEINDESRKVYVLEGMGQRHYYFQSQNLVIWLASEPEVADVAVQQILEVYP